MMKKIPPSKLENELKKELAFTLYQHQFASFGVARRLSGLSKWDFLEELARRQIETHYTQIELEEDMAYACGE